MASSKQPDNQFGRRVGVWPRNNKEHVGYIEWTVSTEAADVRTVTVQAYDLNGEIFDGYLQGTFSLHSAAWGAVETGTTPMTFTTGTLLHDITASLIEVYLSNSTGKWVVSLTDGGANTFYLRIMIGDKVIETTAIDFAA